MNELGLGILRLKNLDYHLHLSDWKISTSGFNFTDDAVVTKRRATFNVKNATRKNHEM
jgi:hypothetical protein